MSVFKSAFAALAAVLVSCHVFIGIDDTGLAPDAGTPDADIPDARSSPDAAVSLVAHVPLESSAPGTVDLVLGDATIKTNELVIETESTLPAVIFDVANQVPSNGMSLPLAILHVRGLTIQRGATVKVTGAFPLVIIAGGSVVIEGILDASADGQVPGADGKLPGEGLGAGIGGKHEGSLDSGGGGAGYGLPGSRGGDALCDGVDCAVAYGGGGGVAYGDESLPVLRGGAGGGDNSCAARGYESGGGGGGGAVQISSHESIVIAENGGIHAGGGGGGGGNSGILLCAPLFSIAGQSGSGGGAGGAIYLQAPSITNNGILAANGGGGGGSAGDGNGGNGQDALLAATPASGGTAGEGTRGAAGGAGGALDAPAEPGGDAPASADDNGNGGGGGGAVGRIVIVSDAGGFDNSGVISPAPHTVPE